MPPTPTVPPEPLPSESVPPTANIVPVCALLPPEMLIRSTCAGTLIVVPAGMLENTTAKRVPLLAVPALEIPVASAPPTTPPLEVKGELAAGEPTALEIPSGGFGAGTAAVGGNMKPLSVL